mgnify:CR=1 FL=1
MSCYCFIYSQLSLVNYAEIEIAIWECLQVMRFGS